MRRLIVVVGLCFANLMLVGQSYADVATVTQAIAAKKPLKQIMQEAVEAGESIEDVMADIIQAAPSMAYEATRLAVQLAPEKKDAILNRAVALGLNSDLVKQSFVSNSNNLSTSSGQNNNHSTTPSTNGNTGGGGVFTGTIFIPVNPIISQPSDGTNTSVGGGGCSGNTVLTKNPATGISRCATKS